MTTNPLDIAYGPATPAPAPAASATSQNPLDIAYPPESPSAAEQVTSDSPEITEGPLGFINAVSGIAGKGFLNIPYAAAHGVRDLYRRATGGDLGAPDSDLDFLHVPLNPNEQNAASAITGQIAEQYGPAATAMGRVARQDFPEATRLAEKAAPYAQDVASILPLTQIGRGIVSRFGGPEIPTTFPSKPAIPAQEVVNRVAARQSMGAAATGVDVSAASPELHSAVQEAGENLNPDVLARHLDAEQLPLPEGETPLRYRKGQATQDPQQISDEKNFRADPDTQGLLTDSIADQNRKLGLSMGEIRRRANPDIVQMTNAEHGQATIDAIKAADNKTVTDIRAKYKALADANGGAMPINTKGVVNDIDAQLSKSFKTKRAATDPDISEVMDKLRSGEPMSFEEFEEARSSLAEVQRGGGTTGRTAGIVRSALEKMPLSAEAKSLKGLADQARSAAAARFETIESNPAYEAAIEDNVKKSKDGLHVIGAKSPLADKFLDSYALGDSKTAATEYIARLKATVPEVGPHLEAATLNKLRDAAKLDLHGNGTFASDGYRNANRALEAKRTTLLSPQSIENTQRLQRVSDIVNKDLPGGSTNYSNSMVALQRYGAILPKSPTITKDLLNAGIDVASGHLGPTGVLGNRVVRSVLKGSDAAKAEQSIRDAKLNFARDAVKPGAGLTHPQR